MKLKQLFQKSTISAELETARLEAARRLLMISYIMVPIVAGFSLFVGTLGVIPIVMAFSFCRLGLAAGQSHVVFRGHGFADRSYQL